MAAVAWPSTQATKRCFLSEPMKDSFTSAPRNTALGLSHSSFFVFLSVFIPPFILSFFLCLRLFVSVCLCLSLCLYVFLSVSLCFSLSLCVSLCLSVFLSVSLCFSLSLYVSLSLSLFVYLFVFMSLLFSFFYLSLFLAPISFSHQIPCVFLFLPNYYLFILF